MLKKTIITLACLIICVNTAFAADTPITPRDPSDSLIILFTTTTCIGCIRAEAFIDSLDEEYALDGGGTTRLDKRIINISEQDGAAIAQRFFEAYNVPRDDRRTPVLFYTGGLYLTGDHVITQNLEMLIRAGALQNFQETLEETPDMSLKLPLIIGAGLLGGVNPCSVSMVLMLLSLLAGRRDRIVRAGVSYIISKFITYLFLGLVLYKSLQVLDSAAFRFAAGAAKWVVVAIAVALCIFNALDYFNARREKYGRIRVQLPKKLRSFNNELIKKTVNSGVRFMIPLVFLLGVVISAGEFLCTGQIYLATILYVLRSGDGFAVTAFLVYVTAMILPMIILLIVCARGRRLLEMSEFARKNMPVIKLANAALFLAFAIYMIGAK
ncbi:MAG: hypothetical protein LBB94_01550 [Clostridiales bacterium]|jgi:cytochrome c biogenesis protein CcdA|nr:hypothetical protein [Clostridiales bacterium]